MVFNNNYVTLMTLFVGEYAPKSYWCQRNRKQDISISPDQDILLFNVMQTSIPRHGLTLLSNTILPFSLIMLLFTTADGISATVN